MSRVCVRVCVGGRDGVGVGGRVWEGGGGNVWRGDLASRTATKNVGVDASRSNQREDECDHAETSSRQHQHLRRGAECVQ